MHLVQILLPAYDDDGRRFPASPCAATRPELVEHFGRLTAYSSAPAEGGWQEGGERSARDDIVVYEVMVEALGRDWWRTPRETHAHRFARDELGVRAQAIERL